MESLGFEKLEWEMEEIVSHLLRFIRAQRLSYRVVLLPRGNMR